MSDAPASAPGRPTPSVYQCLVKFFRGEMSLSEVAVAAGPILMGGIGMLLALAGLAQVYACQPRKCRPRVQAEVCESEPPPPEPVPCRRRPTIRRERLRFPPDEYPT